MIKNLDEPKDGEYVVRVKGNPTLKEIKRIWIERLIRFRDRRKKCGIDSDKCRLGGDEKAY